jgi:hypothetical protein
MLLAVLLAALASGVLVRTPAVLCTFPDRVGNTSTSSTALAPAAAA